MGVLDAIKNRLVGGGHDEYVDDDQYYDDQDNQGGNDASNYDEYDRYDDRNRYDDRDRPDERDRGRSYDDDPLDAAKVGKRRSSVFNDFAPLVSMSDVRSQELPRHAAVNSAIASPARAGQNASGQTASQFKTSLPFVSGSLDVYQEPPEDSSRLNTGSFGSVNQRETAIYAAEDVADPLHKKHSLSNTGDFSATSPAYYASRSGVGHVRPAGQARRKYRFRELAVVTPTSYAEAETVAINLKRENAVILVLTQTRPELAKRILDFSFGAAAVSDAQVVTVDERVYAFTPNHPLTNAELELLQSKGII
ncbi:MAG: cell division protein SepF [Coriobacteriia bacterium]|nr:cell division protein SepF [Coriobacteriia bacterium]